MPHRTLHHVFVASALLLGSTGPALGAGPTLPALPCTAEEDADGSFSTWFMFDQVNLPFERVRARDLASSPYFLAVRVGDNKPGDIASWPDLMAYVDSDGVLALPGGRGVGVGELQRERGPPTWYRYRRKPPEPEAMAVTALGATVRAVIPDSYAWNARKKEEKDGAAMLQIDRRPIRMMDGHDGRSALALVIERVPRGVTARLHAEQVVLREEALEPVISDADGAARVESVCPSGACRVSRIVKVEGDVALMAICAFPMALEKRLRPDCDAWQASAQLTTSRSD